MKSTLDQIEDIKKNGYSLDFATTFDHAFENYKKIAVYSGLIFLVFSIIFAVAYMGTITAIFGIENIKKDFIEEYSKRKLSGDELAIHTIGIAVLSGLFSPFMAGFLKMADSADKDVEFNVSTIFTYYKAPYFVQLFINAFIPALVATGISGIIKNIDSSSIGNTIAIVIPYFISYFMFLSIPLIVFGKLKGIEAIKSSFIIVTKNPLTIFAFFILGFIGSIVGLIGCGVLVFFTIVFNSSMIYATYYAIFGIKQEDSIDSIGNSNVD
ncbi:hypothetical protein NYQ10_19855 [Flavobacterium johnsoniae]|uniref:hypothetical protein n=1 Tax=Flavobacterium johnsoniae TaxID=986 RepID=UPI0025B0653F|nr:hypothetical protein [Flavobacterium johnsoniae]WJS94342.1 hypothetical protein NYQ10_19855 [Flavobacterium johnsoniae]